MHDFYSKPPDPLRGTHVDEADQAENQHQNAALDEALMESFPASDPIAVNITCIRWQAAPHILIN